MAPGLTPEMWILFLMVGTCSDQHLSLNTTDLSAQANLWSSIKQMVTVIPQTVSQYLKLQATFNDASTHNKFSSDGSTNFKRSSGTSPLKNSTIKGTCTVKKLSTAYQADCSRRGLTRVPQGLPTNITHLDLSNNRLTGLQLADFFRYPYLLLLNLSCNQISELSNEHFTGLSKLKSLDLSNNRLNFNDCSQLCCNNPFQALKNLTTLNVKLNMVSLKPLALHQCLNLLPNLEHFAVSLTDNFVFGPEFKELKKLKYLDFSDSHMLTHLTEDFFTNLAKFPLRNLSFAACNLSTIPEGILHAVPKLEKLDLSKNINLGLKNAIRSLKWAHNSSLRVLRLNMLLDPALRSSVILKEEDFEPLSALSLTNLYMDWNSIVRIDNSALEKLPVSLEAFSLCHNNLVYPYNILKPLLRLVNLIVLAATDQSPYFPPNSVGLQNGPFNRNQKLKVGEKKVSPSRIAYRGKPLKDDETKGISSALQREKEVIPVPPKLETVWLTKADSIRFHSSHVIFVNSSIKTLILSNNKLRRFNYWISGLSKVEKLSLSYNQLIIQVGFFDGFSGLRFLFLRYNNMDYSITEDRAGQMFKNLVNLEIIDLANCRISKLFPNVFLKNTRLQKIILPGNKLTSLGCRINHMKNLNLVDLRWNSLAYLDQTAIADLQDISRSSHVVVELFQNPLVCSCDSLEFLKWTLSLPSNITLIEIDNMLCLDENGSTNMSLSSRKEIVRDLQIRCRSYTSIIVGLSVSIITSALVVLVRLVYRYRWKLRYFYHIRVLRRFMRRRPSFPVRRRYTSINTDTDEEIFDVFVAYADEDRRFVTVDMRQVLEDENGLKMYIRDRDSIAGMEIASNIIRAVNQSTLTIVLLSRNFIQNKWCKYEFQMARIEGLVRGENAILYVMYEEVPTAEIPDDLLKAIQHGKLVDMPRNPEIRQDMCTFWTMLIEAIKKHIT